MRAALSLCLCLLSLVACRTSSLGACASDAQCPAGSVCDAAAAVCVAKAGACFPACDAAHTCNATTLTCEVLDQTAPTIALQTDGRTTLFGGGQVDTVVAQITDAGSGVQGATLLIAGRAPIAGVAGSGGAFSFAVPIDDAIVAAGASAVRQFSLSATDRAGNVATLSGDPRQVIRADRDAPAVGALSFVPQGLVDGQGHVLLGGAPGGSVAVQTTISDGAGVAAASVCLRLAGESGACAHAGTNLSGNTWAFTLPRPAAPQDGTTATPFTIEADDALAAAAAVTKAEHQARSAQAVFFDSTGPAISISADPTPYARTAAPIAVSAFIADPAGVPDGGVFLNGTLQPASRDGGLFTFQLDPRGAPAGIEGAYGFQVSARDALGNLADAGGTRIVDDAPPALSVRVFKGADPGTAGVNYPAAVPGTGWDGTQFVYNDTVHVKGTLTDVSGVSAASLHVDGIAIDGGVSPGTPIAIACSGQTTCPFDVQVALNAPTNGAFNSGAAMHQMGNLNAPSAQLHVVIDATDGARSADSAPAAHSASSSLGAQATRLLWQMYLPASVSGLAIHPDGDLVVTLDGGVDTVVALRPDDGGVHWSFGADAGASGLGAIDGTPSVGSGTAATAPIYVAAESGDVYALTPAGAAAWHYSTGDTLNVGPAVATATVASVAVDEVLVDGALATSSIYGLANGARLSRTAVADANNSSAPLILGGSVYYGSASTIASHTISAAGLLGAAATSATVSTNYYEVMTDGTDLFAWRNRSTGLISVNPALAFLWSQTAAPSAGPVVALDGSLIVPLSAGPVDSFSANNTAAPTQLLTLGGAGRTALAGWDGTRAHFYFPRLAAVLFASDAAGNLSWEADPNGTTYRAATMDCAGRVFGASNAVVGAQSLVYALISDDRGLADTAWPSYRLDARNTGNVGSPKYGILSGGTCTQ